MNNCHYCNDKDCPELDWVYGLDHILPEYKFCPMCGKRVEVDRNYPLTMDELWRMDGLPVWVVDNKLTAKCALVYSPCGIVYLTFGDRTRFDAVDLLDNGCKIYRNKPEWCD